MKCIIAIYETREELTSPDSTPLVATESNSLAEFEKVISHWDKKYNGWYAYIVEPEGVNQTRDQVRHRYKLENAQRRKNKKG